MNRNELHNIAEKTSEAVQQAVLQAMHDQAKSDRRKMAAIIIGATSQNPRPHKAAKPPHEPGTRD